MENIKQTTNYEQVLNEANDELRNIFNFKIEDVQIIIARNREEYNQIIGRTTEDWVIGTAINGNKILILDPACWQDDAPTHKVGEESLLIKHELIHLYVRHYTETNQIKLRRYLNEGLAVYLSGQVKKHKKDIQKAKSFFENIDKPWSELVNNKTNPYGISGFFIDYLANNMTIQEILNYVKDNNGEVPQEKINDFINNYFK